MTLPLKFSIITCTWNSVHTLADTIDSVQAQRHQEIEHLFVDGGSTDGTLELIAQRCPNATVLRDVKGGISRAMNAGIRAAGGDVIAHLHSDDYFAANDVLDQVAAVFESAPDCQWAFGKIHVLSNGVVQPADELQKPFTFGRYAAGSATVQHPAVFIRRAAFAKVGMFDETLKYAMDIDLWLRLGQQCQPIQINKPLTVFREHEGSLSSANKLKARQEEWRVRQRYFSRAPFETALFGLRYLRRMWRLRREIAALG